MFTREFTCKSTTTDLRDEVRLSDEDSQSSVLLRDTDGAFERNAVYKVSITKVQKAPEEATVLAEVPVSDVGTLPASAAIKKSK